MNTATTTFVGSKVRGHRPLGLLNLLLSTAQIGVSLWIFSRLATVSTVWQVFLLTAVFVVVGNAMYFMLHEAEHRALHPNRVVNDLMGVILAMFFPAPFALLCHAHLAHHTFNRSANEAFDHYLSTDPKWWKVIQFYGLLTGLFYVTSVIGAFFVALLPQTLVRRCVRFDRQSSAFIGLLDGRTIWLIRLQCFGILLLHYVIVFYLAIPPHLYLTIYLVFGFSWSTMQYLHHYGAPLDRREGALDLSAIPGLSWIWLNHHLHLTHHRYPRVPWTALPTLAKRDNSQTTSMLRQYLRQWRGPMLTEEKHFACNPQKHVSNYERIDLGDCDDTVGNANQLREQIG